MKRFILLIGAILFGLAVRAQSVTYTCRYWFDMNHAQTTAATFSGSTWEAELDVGSLSEGIHTLILQVMDTSMRWSAPECFLFLKMQENPSENLSYHCWIDQDFEHQQGGDLGAGHFLLDVADLEDGLHTVHVMLQGSTLTATQSYIFMKMAVEDPSAEMRYICWFDQDYGSAQTGPLGNGLFELEVGDLPNGIHTVNVQLSNGSRTAPQTYLFYKQPLGGYGIARWEYWLNDDIDNRTTTIFTASVDTLDIVSLLPVGHPALRSSCFHFHPNGDAPYINAKNQINFRIWDVEMRFLDMTKFYVDEQVQQDIVAQLFERNTTETFAAPRNNQIQWFKLDAVVGDSLSFVANKACTMQLFAPSGEEVFNVSGPESITLKGLHAWEDGTYYLAVHDQTGSGETVSVTYNWVYRYAILAYDVHQVGNGGCSTITFQGNGFNSLLDVYLVNAQNDTIRRIDIGHESNSLTTVTFNFYQENLGVYDAVFQFMDEEIRIMNAVQVEEPSAILLTNSVSYPTSFMSGTPVKYSYTITNQGNMSAYRIPIYIYISTLSSVNVTSIKLDGLNLPSLIDGMSMDSLSESAILKLKQLSDNLGDLHHFFAFNSIDENTGDSISVLSNYFFLNMAPLESKSLDIFITATTGPHNPLNVWITVPNDTVQPLVLSERGIRDQYCCVKDKMECVLTLTSDVSGIISDLFPGTPAGTISHIIDCASSTLSTLSSSIGDWVCREENEPLPSIIDNTKSYVSLIMNCYLEFLPTEELEQFLDKLSNKFSAKLDTLGILGVYSGLKDVFGIIGIAQSMIGFYNDLRDCVTVFTTVKPNCPPGNPIGGQTDGQTPGDPNDIHGYLSESGSHYMRQEIQNVQYEIEFENDTTLATAAAHTIIVRDTLDATKFDLNSLAARSVTIGDKRLDLNGEQTFARTLDMRPELYVIAQIEQDYDPTTGIVEWTIQSLDPMTMEPTDNPYQGVLPVNYFGDGVGFIDYSINLKQAFADGTAINNRAGIIFDQNDVIMTPTWTNIVDAVKPTSHIEEVSFEDDTLNFSFISSDNRSGVWYHSLYYRNAFTEMEWQVKKPQIFENDFMLKFDDWATTEYLVMAVDSAGNREEKEMVAEYIHYYDGVSQTDALVSGWNWFSTYIEASNPVALLQMLETALGEKGLYIESSELLSTEYLDGEWIGDLDEVGITNEQMYLIQTSDGCTIQLHGALANPANHEITIHPEWNWVGYPCSEEMTIAEALAGLVPEDGDQIESMEGYAEYLDGEWLGLETLKPGQGFLYYSNSDIPKTFVFPTNSK